MKLHLPKMLTAALLAAFTTVGFTLTQAQAKVSTLTAQNAAGWAVLQDNTWVYSESFSGDLSTSTEFQITSDDSPISFTANNDASSYATYTFAVTLDLSKLSVNSDTILLRGGGLSGIGVEKSSGKLTETWQANAKWGIQNYVLPSEGSVTIVHTEGSGGGFVAVYSADGTTVKLTRSGSGGLRGSGDILQTFYASQSLVDAATAIAVWETNGTMDDTQMQNAAKAMPNFPLYPATDYTWAATTESATWDITSTVWNTSEKPGTNYVSAVTSSAIFNSGEYAKDVTVSGEIKADKVNVNDNYKFTIANGSSLTLDALTVANGMKATVAGTGSVTLNSLTGALVIEAGATVNMPTTVTLDATHQLPVSGEGTFGVTTLKVAGGTHDITNSLKVTGGGNGEGGTDNKLGLNFSGANGTLNLNAGTTTVTGAVYSNQGGTKINIGTGEKEATLVARRIELSDGGSSALHIGAKGKVVITSTNDTNGSTGAYKTTGLLLSEWLGSTTATVDGKLYAQSVGLYTGDAGMTLNVNNGGVVAVKGIATNLAQSGHTSSSTINLAEGGKIVLGASGMANCTIAPWTINLNGGEIGITADATLARAMNVAGNVTFNTAKYEWADSGATLNEGVAGGTMTVSGNLTGTGTITKTGDGTLVLSGATNVISNTINLQAGTLSLTGAYDISALTSSTRPTYVTGGSQDIAEGNGFKHAEGKVRVVNITAGTLSAATATFTYGAEHGTGLNEDGDFVLQGSTDYSTLYVNNNDGVVSYNAAWEVAHAQEVELTSVVMAADTTLTADKADASFALTVNGNATVAASAATTIASIEGWSDSTLTITGEGAVTLLPTTNPITLEGSTKLDVQGNAATKAILVNAAGAALTVADGATLDITGNLSPVHGTVSLNGTVNISGELDLSKGKTSDVHMQIGSTGNVTSHGLWMNKNAALELDANAIYTNGDMRFTGKVGSGSITVASGDEIHGLANNSRVTNLAITALGDITLANQLTNVDVTTGEHTVKLNSTIAVESTGTMVLDGTFAIDENAGTRTSTYAGGEVANNGFATTTTTRTVYTVAEGGDVDIDNAHFMLGGSEVDLDNGRISTAATDNTMFWVNSGTEKVSTAKQQAELQDITVVSGAKLVVDDGYDSAHIHAAVDIADVEIAKDVTLNGTIQNMVLHGEGIYALNNNTAALGTGVTLGDDWDGIVRVTNLSTTDQSSPWISNLAKGESWVEFINFTGYDHAWAHTFEPGGVTANIILTDDADHHAAWNLTACAGTMFTMKLAGDVKGNGTFKTSGDKSQAIEFRGDISGWTGAFVADASGTRQVVFSNDATDVRASITRQGAGTLELVVNNDATFAKEVNVSSTTLNGAATFAADSTLGAVTINNGGGLAVGENATVNTTSVTASGEATTMSGAGTLVLAQAVSLTSGTLTMSGVYNIDAFEYEGERTIEGGVNAGNGFATEKGSLTVVTRAEGATLVAGEASVVRGGNRFSLANDGTVSLNSANYATFYITNLSETVTKAKSKEAESHVDLSSIHVSNGATLTVDQSIDLSLVTAETGAKLNILSGQTVSVGDATTTATIAGEGTYALKSGSKTMAGTLAEGSDWTGTVVLSNISGDAGKNLNLNTYGHDGSKVEINGFTGYFLKAQEEFAPELVLGANGLTLNDGYSDLGGATKPPTKYTFAGGVSGTGSMTFNKEGNVTQHLYFTGDVARWTGSLNVVGGFTVYAQYSGEQTVNSLISRVGGTLNVEVGTGSGASVVTYTQAITSDSLAVNAGATAYINGGLTTSTITVADGATLAINGNTTLTSAITSAGTVTLTNVALSDAFQAQEGGEKQYFVESTANYYLGTAYEYLAVVTGEGAANATGTGLTWGSLDSLAMAAGQVKVSDHGTASYDTLYIGQDTTTAEIALYDNIGSLANIVVKNGKLTVGEDDLQQPVTISVIEHGTISGDVTPEEVGIAEDATAEFTKPVTGNHYTFSAAEGETVAVTNNGETPAAYTSDNRDLTVVADTLEAPDAWEEVTISNIVQVKNVVAGDAAILTLDNVDGTLDLQNLEIGSMAFVQVYASDEHLSENEATVVISDTLTAGLGSTLNADLTMKGNSTLDLDGSNGIAALTLGSKLTLDTADGLINLDEDIISYLSNMQVGESVDLFTHGFGTSLDYGDEYEGAYYDALFVRTDALVGDFTVYADGDHFGLTKYNNVPEPTTGTLSLLALMALAARRRKH